VSKQLAVTRHSNRNFSALCHNTTDLRKNIIIAGHVPLRPLCLSLDVIDGGPCTPTLHVRSALLGS